MRKFRLSSAEWRNLLISVGVFVLAAIIPKVADGYPLQIAISIVMYTVLATSWLLFSGPTNYIALSTAAFFGIGMYITAGGIDLLPYPVLILVSGIAGALAALDVLIREPERRDRLWDNTRRVADGLRAIGLDIGQTQTPVIPVLIGETTRAFVVWRALFDAGIFTHPIVPPAVPANSCRIRVSMSAEHSREQVDRVLEAFEKVARELSLVGEPAAEIPSMR